jgi:acetoin utilization protein AcuB
MLVKEKMSPQPITITRQTTIAKALQLMRENKIRRLPVLDSNKLVGIVTDRDLSEVSPSPATSLSIFELNYLLAKTGIGDILPKNQQVITIGPDNFIEEAALLMREHKIGAVPVVDGSNVIGIITETNIFDAFVELMGLKQKGYRITIKPGTDHPGILAELTRIIASNNGNITHITTFSDDKHHPVIVIRINTGDIEKIMAAINDLGYESSYLSTE